MCKICEKELCELCERKKNNIAYMYTVLRTALNERIHCLVVKVYNRTAILYHFILI